MHLSRRYNLQPFPQKSTNILTQLEQLHNVHILEDD
jgi:hypothetical protein